ncbi:thiol reductant ABC exporter subunit CydD [Pseudonocardia endophytica]|uniref:ATP-binding cassette subfamily C protein CydCD n=1 Tax=Pseudonocardia endophytica TaxID=401976 RepID=A0A4R1HKB7_PSEEN|nr:thiol reductant ABC exporter subunit CydD [Pseudonocardia endophytica]TCK22338.1 ATP-binding cassette subfamily C protein CydCD [Pseudonocardia endophytica]
MRPLDPRLLREAAAARRFVVLGAGIAVVAAVLVLVQAELLSRLVAEGFLGGAGLAALAPALAGVAAVTLGRAGLVWAGEAAAHRAGADVVRRLRRTLVDRVLRLGPQHPDLPSTAEVTTVATRGLDDVAGYFGRYLPALLVAAVVPVVVGVRILTADWLSGVIVGATVPLIPVFAILVGLHTERSTRRQWRALAVLGHHFLDLLSGLDTLVAFGRARRQGGRLRALAEAHRRATMRTLRVAFLSALVLELVATLSVALVAVSIGLRLVDGRLDLATGLLVLLLAPEVYLPLRAVGARFHDAAAGAAAVDDALAVIDLPVPARGGDPAPDPAGETIRLRGIRIDGRSGPVLDGLDLDIAPGTLLGVEGRSGAGKTTLLDVITGLRTPDAGSIRVGGVDLSDIDRDAWLGRVARVYQRPVLLAGTVADNLLLGSPGAGVQQLGRAAELAGLDVSLDTPVGEDGAGLSTGQRRRVALARALVADRPLLLLDEPTEGVDAETEVDIAQALGRIAMGRTVVVVSHRPELLARCDRVLTVLPPARHVRAVDGLVPMPAARTAATPTTGVPAPAARADAPAGAVAVPAVADDPSLTAPAAWWSSLVAPGQRWRLPLALVLGSAALGSGVALTATSAWLISAAALQPPVLTLMVAIVAVRAFGLGKGVLRYAERLVSHDAALRAGSAERARIWARLVALGPAASARLRRGDLLARLVSDADAPQDLLVRSLLPAASAVVVGAATTVGLALLRPAAGLALACGLCIAGIAAPALAAATARRTERRSAALRGDVTSRTVELLSAAPELLVLGAAERYRDALAEVDDRLARVRRRSALAVGAGQALATAGLGAATVACAAAGLVALRAGTLPGPALAVLVLTPLALAEVVAGLPDAAVRLLSVRPALQRLRALDRVEPAVADRPLAARVDPPHELRARDLAVRWPGAGTDAVHGLDLDLRGNRVALVGPSGSGKSSVVATMLRTLDPAGGRLEADGRGVTTVAADDVRAGIAWCGPWTHLFDSTLRANLALARPDASDEEMVAVLRRARLGAWFDGLPHGLDTPLGEHGGAVSGGERQRLGVTRALLADRPVLVLDEPTAHLDPATADSLSAELIAATEGRTALLVTHRPEHLPGLDPVRLGRERDPVLSA